LQTNPARPRVERHRHHAGTDRAEEHDRKIGRVEYDHRHAFLAANAETAQHVGGAATLLLQLAIGQLTHGVGESELAAAPFIDIAIEQPRHGVIRSGIGAHPSTLSPQLSEL
jgi:hypothetical protein